MKYYDISKLLATKSLYHMVFSERSNGKSYQALLHGLKNFVKNGEQIAIIRRWKEDFRGKRAHQMWDNLVCNEAGENKVREITKGKYDNIIYKSGCWYLAYFDNNLDKFVSAHEPIAYAFALSDLEHDKSTSYPHVTTIFFDEFMSIANVYLPNEFVSFMQTCSTIIRGRDNVIIIMCANTISKYCPYFEEMGLTHVRQMKKGDIDVYKYGDSGLQVAVEYADTLNKNKPSDKYFAFDNPALRMITNGEWQLNIYPHLLNKFEEKDVKLSYFIIYKDVTLQADIVINKHEAFTFIHRKTTPIKHEYQDIVFTTEADQRINYFGRLTKPTNKTGTKLWYFFVNNKVFYSTNEVGEIMNHYLQWCKTG